MSAPDYLAILVALIALVRITVALDRLVNAVDRNTLVQIQARELERKRADREAAMFGGDR